MYYTVEVLEFGSMCPEYNPQFSFDDFESAIAYCKELDLQGREFSLFAQYEVYE